MLGLPGGNFLIDTPADLRGQLIREKIGIVHAVAFTHEHADHIMGLDDLRLNQFYLGGPVPLYCERVVHDRLKMSFDYAFADREQTHAGAVPQFDVHEIELEPFEVLGTAVTPIRLKHGPRFDVLGFRVGNVAYCTDTNEIPSESMERLEGLDVLILDALRHSPHVTHFNLEEAIEVATKIGAKRTLFTHCACELDYELTSKLLPDSMKLAYDGLRFELS